MAYRDFECITYYDLGLKIQGFRQHMAVKENWMRHIAYSAYSPHLGKKVKTLTLEKFWPLPEIDDRKKKKEKLTPDRRKRIGDTIKQMMAGNGKARDDN